jgi:hypothetical protein
MFSKNHLTGQYFHYVAQCFRIEISLKSNKTVVNQCTIRPSPLLTLFCLDFDAVLEGAAYLFQNARYLKIFNSTNTKIKPLLTIILRGKSQLAT